MPQSPPKSPAIENAPTADEEKTSFFQRWSERKREAASHASPSEILSETLDDTAGGQAAPDAAVSSEPPPTITEADLENLSYESDYTKFMSEHVPEALRRQALRQLWRSDPILANLDGLCDYNDDYTDAALAVQVLQTAHRVGQGYLTDDEVAANRARGEPKPVVTAKDGADEISDAQEIDEPGTPNAGEAGEDQAGTKSVGDEEPSLHASHDEAETASNSSTEEAASQSAPVKGT